MSTTSLNCKEKGCHFIWAIHNNVTGQNEPIGLVNSASLNSAVEDSDTSGEFAGTLAEDQTTPLATEVVDGEEVLASTETRFEIDGVKYLRCGGSNSGCVDTLNLGANFCFQKDCDGSDTGTAANQRKLACNATLALRLLRLNPTALPLSCGPVMKQKSPARTARSIAGKIPITTLM